MNGMISRTMSLLLGAATVGLVAASIAGCPIYSDKDCTVSSTNKCDCKETNTCNGTSSGGCTSSAQCGAGQTCGRDDACHAENCVAVGCPGSQVCKLENGTATCQPSGSSSGGVTDGGPNDGAISDASQPTEICNGDGVQSTCSAGSLCVRGGCYISCEADASDACKYSDHLNVCKAVSAYGKTLHLCGSATDVGSDCDVDGSTCAAGFICIDGRCK
jgi:hypothetical protein